MLRDNVQLLKIVFDFLSLLTDGQFNDLMSKKAKLKLEYSQPVETTKKPVADIGVISEQLNLMTTCEQAREYIESLNVDKSTLIEISKHYDIPIKSKDRNSQLLDKIVENVVGAKLRYDTLLNVKLNKP